SERSFRASESSVRPRKKLASAGAVSETAMVSIVITRISSMSVNPASDFACRAWRNIFSLPRLNRPIRDDFIASWRPTATQVVRAGIVSARAFVNVFVAPGIQRDPVRLQIGSAPILRVARLCNEIAQPAFPLGITARIDLESIKSGTEGGD